MARKLTKALRLITAPVGVRGHRDSRGDGLVHISGTSLAGFETLCGYCDTFLPWEAAPPAAGVSCRACWEVFATCRASVSFRYTPATLAERSEAGQRP